MFGRRKKTKESLSQRTSKSIGRRILQLFSKNSPGTTEFFENMENLLVESDFGVLAAMDVVDDLRDRYYKALGAWEHDRYVSELKDILKSTLESVNMDPNADKMTLYLILGVNGVGKTTTIAKMAQRFIHMGYGPVVLAAADTFRAAAADQLALHAERIGARIVQQSHGSDPGAVIYDAITSARSRGDRVVIADTAGRMHNKKNLVKELEKIDRIARDRMDSDGVYKKILVLDATTGQNAMQQAEAFNDSVGVDAVVLTKYDSSAKGGMVAAIGRKIGLPFAYIGHGESMDDLIPFEPETYLDDLLGLER